MYLNSLCRNRILFVIYGCNELTIVNQSIVYLRVELFSRSGNKFHKISKTPPESERIELS